MVTYANGDLCSRLLYDCINKSYTEKLKSYLSFFKNHLTDQEIQQYLKKDGEFLTCYPPGGDTIQQLYGDAANSTWNGYGISNKNRNTHEIQGVGCKGGNMAQDHTFQMVKNYPSKIKAKAAWGVATETGEIASAVLVKNTKTENFAHVAEQLA